jgi:hypothetical protein
METQRGQVVNCTHRHLVGDVYTDVRRTPVLTLGSSFRVTFYPVKVHVIPRDEFIESRDEWVGRVLRGDLNSILSKLSNEHTTICVSGKFVGVVTKRGETGKQSYRLRFIGARIWDHLVIEASNRECLNRKAPLVYNTTGGIMNT